jgi:hypothetical protein
VRPFAFPQRATEAAAEALAGDGSSRRDFLSRVAAFGAAFATKPVQSVLRPEAAYANHCPDPGCSSGYSVFCCTFTGKNDCPNNTYPGGWWWAAVSTLTCGSGFRYYLDCVGYCDENCGNCTCVDDPPTRRTCCNTGYTNCGLTGHLHCRIVRCDIQPDLLFPQCSSSGTADHNTCSHGSNCLGSSKCR